MSERKQRPGLTLVELLFVVLVLGIITAVSMFRPGFDFTSKSKVRIAAQRLVSDLRLTRRLAITNHENYKLTVYPDACEYKIFDASNTQARYTRELDSGITLTGDTDFIFASLGNASSGSSLSVAIGVNQYDISVVSATGMVSMQEH